MVGTTFPHGVYCFRFNQDTLTFEVAYGFPEQNLAFASQQIECPNAKQRPRADLNRDRWIQSPEC